MKHERADDLVRLSIPPMYRCTCGSYHTAEELGDLQLEEELARWSEIIPDDPTPDRAGP